MQNTSNLNTEFIIVYPVLRLIWVDLGRFGSIWAYLMDREIDPGKNNNNQKQQSKTTIKNNSNHAFDVVAGLTAAASSKWSPHFLP